MRKNKVMFENPIIEFLSRSNPILISIVHLFLIVGFYYFGIAKLELELYVQILLFALGIFTWTLAEYLIHRYVFHWTSKNRIFRIIHYVLHGHHHENPTDRNHLFMPPIPVVLISFFLFTSFYFFIGNYAFYFFPGFELGYLIYSMIHYSVHLKPFTQGIMKKLWIHHGKHHYENSSCRYGVSNTFWDRVFRTLSNEN
jgi:sterol desaturase/sphingolipid hydroxylase (fatty acid hydroxylase superfamily)